MLMPASVVQPAWRSVLSLGSPQNSQAQSRQVRGLNDSGDQVSLLSMHGSTYALDVTSVIWSVPLA